MVENVKISTVYCFIMEIAPPPFLLIVSAWQRRIW